MLAHFFGDKVGLIHGKMKGPEKDAAMAAFAAGTTQVLVATTVIEVGVDVPEATIIVIEHAERFGLSQIHQLRGRVGRGSGASVCVLLYKGPLSARSRKRASRSCARARTGSGSRRRICGCAAKARCWAPASPDRPASSSLISLCTAPYCRSRARRGAAACR